MKLRSQLTVHISWFKTTSHQLLANNYQLRAASITLLILLLTTTPLWAADRRITSYADSGVGSLREAIDNSCLQPGDDNITFNNNGVHTIPLQSPLVITDTCNGAVTLDGPQTGEVILGPDGSRFTSGAGLLEINSWGHTVRDLTFAGYAQGAGLVIRDTDNIIENNLFGVFLSSNNVSPNRVGIQVLSDFNILRGNTTSANLAEGLVLQGNGNVVTNNNIGHHTGCPEISFLAQTLADLPLFIREINHEPSQGSLPIQAPLPIVCGNGGSGLSIAGNDNVIGGSRIEESNRILFNRSGGVVISSGARNRITQNVFSRNTGPGITVQAGAQQAAPLQNLTIDPLDEKPLTGIFRYVLSGQGVRGTVADLYLVDPEDNESASGGEGARYLESFVVSGSSFSHILEERAPQTVPLLVPGRKITAIVCAPAGNCSGFATPVKLDRDSDHDGLPDSLEDLNGNLVVDLGETDPLSDDTDGDGLPDSVEDRNLNGIVESNETDPKLSDTDVDGLSDFVEVGGDGSNDPQEGDTNPRNPNTDGDSLLDGQEDLNRNGCIELGETDPRNPDTNGDGTPD